MRFKGAEEAKKQATELGEHLNKTVKGLTTLLENLKSELNEEAKDDFKKYKDSPEGRKQAEMFEKIRKGVSEVMDNVPK